MSSEIVTVPLIFSAIFPSSEFIELLNMTLKRETMITPQAATTPKSAKNICQFSLSIVSVPPFLFYLAVDTSHGLRVGLYPRPRYGLLTIEAVSFTICARVRPRFEPALIEMRPQGCCFINFHVSLDTINFIYH